MDSLWIPTLAALGLALLHWERLQKSRTLKKSNAEPRKMIYKTDTDLEKISITEENVFELEFDYHVTLGQLHAYFVRIKAVNAPEKTVQLETLKNLRNSVPLQVFNMQLSEETFNELYLLSRKDVFKHKYGKEYDLYLSCYHTYTIKKAGDENRDYSLLTITYRIKPEQAITKKLKNMYVRETMKWTVAEARFFKANTTHWVNPPTKF